MPGGTLIVVYRHTIVKLAATYNPFDPVHAVQFPELFRSTTHHSHQSVIVSQGECARCANTSAQFSKWAVFNITAADASRILPVTSFEPMHLHLVYVIV
jgi:hypothetical protein